MEVLGKITYQGEIFNLVYHRGIHSLRLEQKNKKTIILTMNISGLEKNQIAFFMTESTKEIFEVLYDAEIAGEPITWISDKLLLCNIL